MIKNETHDLKPLRPLSLTIPDQQVSTECLSPYNLNLNLLSPEPEDNYQIPSPYDQPYIESVSSPVYPRFIDRSPAVSPIPLLFSKPDLNNNNTTTNNNSINRSFSMYDAHKSERTSYMSPPSVTNQRLNHSFPMIKTEPMDEREEKGDCYFIIQKELSFVFFLIHERDYLFDWIKYKMLS